MEKVEIIRERLDRIITEQNITKAKLAEIADVKPQAVNNWYKNGKISINSAKAIYNKFGYPIDWVLGEGDVPQNSTGLSVFSSSLQSENENAIVIKVLDIHASAGFGAVNGDVIQVVKELRFVPEAFYQYYPGINPQFIRIINVKGDSMAPTFNHADLLFVDISIPYFDGDGIYVFTFDNTLFVKRVQKTGREFCIISDNETNYKPWNIKPEEMPDMIFHAKVRVHQSQKLNFIG